MDQRNAVPDSARKHAAALNSPLHTMTGVMVAAVPSLSVLSPVSVIRVWATMNRTVVFGVVVCVHRIDWVGSPL